MKRHLDEDDNFFHITCHIDEVLHAKIEKGQYVELERLLAKERPLRDEQPMQMVNHDGVTYFVNATSRESKISGIRKWDQAFRVYAAIYSRANLHRSAKIWQYVDVIHLAANSYMWDSMSLYDVTF